jgi:hypothetical protein
MQRKGIGTGRKDDDKGEDESNPRHFEERLKERGALLRDQIMMSRITIFKIDTTRVPSSAQHVPLKPLSIPTHLYNGM